MKLRIMPCLLLCLLILFLAGTAIAKETDIPRFSLGEYSEEELTSIRDLIYSQQSKAGGEVVVDKEGLIVEWNGLIRRDYEMGIADLTITNLTGADINLKLVSQSINGFKVDTWNNDFDIEAGERVLLKAKHNFMFSAEKVIEECDISHITSFGMELSVAPADDDKQPLFDASFSIALDMPLSDLWHY